jgi:hypothetical protein
MPFRSIYCARMGAAVYGTTVGWLIAGAVAVVVLAVAWFGVRRRVRPLTSPRG